MRTDRVVLTVVIVLVLFGNTSVLSSSAYLSIKSSENESEFQILRKHLERVLLGSACLILALRFDYRRWKKLATPILALTFVLMILTLVFEPVRNTRRFIALGPISFQPSEMAKFAIILYLAEYISRKGKILKEFRKGYLGAVVPIFLFSFILVLQPNFGMLMLFSSTAFLVLWIGGARNSHIFLTLAVILVLFSIGISLNPYAEHRFMQFVGSHESYQIRQARITVGSGGMFGSGLGKQSFYFLPWPHTDFIFATIAEETGFLVSSGLMILFLTILLRGLRISRRAPCAFGYILGLGVASSIFLQAMLHIGVNLGVFPTTGLPLPFMSYGGTALVMNMFGIGVLLNIAKKGESENGSSVRRHRRPRNAGSLGSIRIGW
jgi:cell division protein FtsW